MKKVLVVCAHPDDEAYGPGATIYKNIANGEWDVRILTITNGVNSPEDNTFEIGQSLNNSCRILGIREGNCRWPRLDDQKLDKYLLLDIIKKIDCEIFSWEPQIVLTHNISDLNLDHRLVSEATMVSCRPRPNFCVEELWMYEVPSATDWGFGQFGSFEPNLFVEVGAAMAPKEDSIKEYGNELEPDPHARSLVAVLNLASKRGQQVGIDFAEAFKIVWKKIPMRSKVRTNK